MNRLDQPDVDTDAETDVGSAVDAAPWTATAEDWWDTDAEDVVPTGAIATALHSAELLAGRVNGAPIDLDDTGEPTGEHAGIPTELAEAVEHWGIDTLLRAYSLLIYGAIAQTRPNPDSPPHPPRPRTKKGGKKSGRRRRSGPAPQQSDDDPLHTIVPAVVDRMQKIELIQPRHLPTVAALLTTAALGRDPYRWRTALGPIPLHELGAWCATTRLLADLLDTVAYHRPGAFAEITLTALAAPDDDDDDDEGEVSDHDR